MPRISSLVSADAVDAQFQLPSARCWALSILPACGYRASGTGHRGSEEGFGMKCDRGQWQGPIAAAYAFTFERIYMWTAECVRSAP